MANMPSRPWRIELSDVYGRSGVWIALSTFTTKELASENLNWYRRHGIHLRIRNRVTGEIVEVADHA